VQGAAAYTEQGKAEVARWLCGSADAYSVQRAGAESGRARPRSSTAQHSTAQHTQRTCHTSQGSRSRQQSSEAPRTADRAQARAVLRAVSRIPP
jgi:hypothetical protein